MKFAIDGGAFQQGIAAGILNVGVGLINAVTRIRPDITFVLVVDPRLGPVREDLLSRLIVKPDIVFGAIGQAYSNSQKHLTTDNANIQFEVDKSIYSAKLTDGQVLYNGPSPNNSFRILSRADRPSITRGGGDRRLLGVKIDRIAIRAGTNIAHIELDHPSFTQGFHDIEGVSRWTSGAANIPLEFFPHGKNNIEVIVGINSTMSYRVSEGIFDDRFEDISNNITQIMLQRATAEVGNKLTRLGVSAYIANHFLPTRFDGLINYAILYDMIPVLYPKFFFEDARKNFMYNVEIFKKADHVFSISESSRADLIATTDVRADRITAIMIDIDPTIVRKTDSEVEGVRIKYGLQARSYILTVGTLEPRKNHAQLISAFAGIVNGGGPMCDLVLVGKPGWGTDNLLEQIERHGLQNRVHMLTDVPNDNLAALYSGALFSVYPSLYEGFGLPVLESMACGCAVMTSNRSSMPEIASDAALLIDPTSADSLVKGLYTMLTNDALRKRLVVRGLEKRKEFSWEATAQRFINIIGAH